MNLQMIRCTKRPVRVVQVLGERCSGTNFVASLLLGNLAITRTDAFGWKHGFPAFVAAPAAALAVIVFRNAMPWLRSLYGKPWHTSASMRSLTFPEFIRCEWKSEVDRARFFGLPERDGRVGQPLQFDRHPITGATFPNVVQLRNAKNAAFLGYADRGVNVAFCQYEWVCENIETFLEMLATEYSIQRKPELKIQDRKFGWEMKKRQGQIVLPDLPFDRADELFIHSELDHGVEARLGYTYRLS